MHFLRRRYEVPIFSQMSVTMDLILKKWQLCFEIQDGGSRYLENYTSG